MHGSASDVSAGLDELMALNEEEAGGKSGRSLARKKRKSKKGAEKRAQAPDLSSDVPSIEEPKHEEKKGHVFFSGASDVIASADAKKDAAVDNVIAFSKATQDADAEADGESQTGRVRRAGDIRAEQRAERAKRARAQYRRYILRIALSVAIVLVVVFGSIFVYRSDFLHIDNVQVEGVSHLSSAEITEIAAIPADATLLRLDSSGITSRLEQNAWIQSATVHRVFPNTITISVTERTPGAVVRLSNKSKWVISSDGAWLSAASDDDWKNDMRIIDVSESLSSPISGSTCDDGGIQNALAILSGISDNLKGQIESISAASSIKTSLNLKNGITVAFGDSSDIQLKEAVIDQLLEQYSGKISYINVRVPSKPTYRTLSS